MPVTRKQPVLPLLLGWLMGLGVVTDAWPVQARQADPMRGPVRLQAAKQSTSDLAVSSPATVFDGYMRFFQRVISPVDGARSNMYPTGSAYARQAFQKHGALLGLVLTTERLLHEGNEGRIARRVRKYGLWRIYDPVEANDWWWQKPEWVYQSRPPVGQR